MKRLEPAADRSAEDVVAGLDLAAGGRDERPRVVAVMIGSIDGRATVGGTSGPLGHPEDRALLRGVRAAVDAVLAGTATIGAERYATLLDDDQRAARAAAGRAEHPIVATITRTGKVPWEAPVWREAGVRGQVYSGVAVAVPDAATEVDVELLDPPDARRALEHLHRERAVASVSCEGGPSLLRALVADDLVDDLLLTVAPLLVAGDGPTGLVGAELGAPPPRMRLVEVHRAAEHLFLHYAR